MPFKDVYIHGLVRDENGKKMSKTANNGIDPLILIDKYGTDALRYTLIRDVAGAGQDISLQYDRKTDQSESVEASRNFANKLWNAARFVMMHLKGETPQSLGTPEIDKLELCDRWILSRFHQTVQQTRKQIEAYGLGEAAKGLYEFIWGDFCDWYIELVKTRLWQETPSRDVARQTLAYILDGTLKLLHPFMPHITEEIWQTLSQSEGQFIPVQAYPEVDNALINTDLETSFTLLFETIRTLRNMRAEADIKPGVKVSVILQSENEQERTILESGRKYIQDVGKVETLTITPQLEQQTEQVIAGVVGTIQALIPLTGVVDIASLRAKLEKSLAKIEAEIKSLSGRLNNPGFVNKAPEAVVQGARDALAEAQKQAEILRERLKRLQ
ncbi:class I tRNA ligase family protein, partial [Crocosphaera sp.]